MPRILIANDDPGVAGLHVSPVHDGFCVEVDTTGQKVLLQVEDKQPDLVLVDPTVPGTRGWDLCRSLIEEYHLPVIVLAGRVSELDARVRAVLRRYAANRSS